ncbi:hypothetical protein D3C71_1116930 [compost metagenome]
MHSTSAAHSSLITMSHNVGAHWSSASHSGQATPIKGVKVGSFLFSARLPALPPKRFKAVGLGFLPRPGTVAAPPIAPSI